MNALVVDDSRAMRRILRSILTEMGFRVVEAENGKDGAAKIVEEGPFEVVLIDWNMPVMDGLELVKHIRKDFSLDPVKLVMVTMETEPVRMARALMSGVDEFVMKPFTKQMLVDKLSLIGVQGSKKLSK